MKCKITRRGFRGRNAPPENVIAAAERIVGDYVGQGARRMLVSIRPSAYIGNDRASYMLELHVTLRDMPDGDLHRLVVIDKDAR